jgi:hypothetical protein
MEPRGVYRERNGWAENEHSARVKYDEHQELDISEHLYRARDYQPPFDELRWLDEIANDPHTRRCCDQERKWGPIAATYRKPPQDTVHGLNPDNRPANTNRRLLSGRIRT